jgi:hypothetical protein
MKNKKPFPYHIFLVGLCPLLNIYSQHTGYMGFLHLVRTAALIAGITAVVWLALWGVYRDRYRAGLLVSLGLILALLWEFRVNQVVQWEVVGFAQHGRIKMVALDALLLGGAFVGLRFIKEARFALTQILNGIMVPVTAVALVMVFINLAPAASKPVRAAAAEMRDPSLTPPQPSPDIYYIILDGYGRSDVLGEMFGFDNSFFVDGLTDMGFHVSKGSVTNYTTTVVSMASALNMDYVSSLLATTPTRGDDDVLVYRDLIRSNRIERMLKREGYETVRFASGFEFTENPDADHNWSPLFNLSELEANLWRMTPGHWIDMKLRGSSIPRDRVLHTLSHIGRIPQIDAPTFAFIHIICPHAPFIFGPDGKSPAFDRSMIPIEPDPDELAEITHPLVDPVESRKVDYYRRMYSDQARYLSEQMLLVVSEILAKSETPPIIVIQGDHGPNSLIRAPKDDRGHIRERFPILNAYHLPAPLELDDSARKALDSITPVNSFRFIFNEYFGARLEMLKNEAFWSTYDEAFVFTPLDEQTLRDLQNEDAG